MTANTMTLNQVLGKIGNKEQILIYTEGRYGLRTTDAPRFDGSVTDIMIQSNGTELDELEVTLIRAGSHCVMLWVK